MLIYAKTCEPVKLIHLIFNGLEFNRNKNLNLTGSFIERMFSDNSVNHRKHVMELATD
jgi:hypothetical protein